MVKTALVLIALTVGLVCCTKGSAKGAGATDGGGLDAGVDVVFGDAGTELPGETREDSTPDLAADQTLDTGADLAADLDAAETTYPVLCPEYVKAMKQCGLPVPPDSSDFCATATQAFWRCYAEATDCEAAAACQLLLESDRG